MKILLAAMALTLATGTAAMAFDADTQSIIDAHKRGKLVGIEDVAHLMGESAKWCYDRQGETCIWTDIYLDVSDSGAIFEIGNAWDEDTDIAFTDEGTFRDNKICQSGLDWGPSVRAMRRADGTDIGGRALHDIKLQIASNQAQSPGDMDDCFDYLYVSADADSEQVTLLQRQYMDGVTDSANDVEVTLSFNPEDAAKLAQRL